MPRRNKATNFDPSQDDALHRVLIAHARLMSDQKGTLPPLQADLLGGDAAVRTDRIAGVNLEESKETRQFRMVFTEQPSASVKKAMLEAKWQKQATGEFWTMEIDQSQGWKTRADAERLFDKVTSLIREHKGITQER